jgi:hypothetical protein
MPEATRADVFQPSHHGAASTQYRPRRPEETLLHQTVRENLETFLARAQDGDHPVPHFVEREFRAYLECGVLAHGFLRLHCDGCGLDRLLPFSCKGRFCPSCCGRRMSDTAAQLVDRVLPAVPVRQWVLTLPYPLRYRCASDAKLMSEVLNVFLRALFASLRRRARRQGLAGRLQCGAVSFLQRFAAELRSASASHAPRARGSAINLNCHIHTLALDGVYPVSGSGPIRFHLLPPPDDDEVHRVVVRVARRLAKLLSQHGSGEHGDLSECDPLAERDPLLATLAAASIQGRVATGPRAGQRLLRLGDRVDPEDLDYLEATPPPRCANAAGLSLHADVAVPARDRKRLERLARYCGRPPIASDRLSKLADGRLCYRLKHRWRDGTTHVVLDPVDLLERLATFVPSPRSHMVRYHGILAPSAGWRDRVVPQDTEPAMPEAAAERSSAMHRIDTTGQGGDSPTEPPFQGAPPRCNSRQPPAIGQAGSTLECEPPAQPSSEVQSEFPQFPSPIRRRRLSWAELLKRVFAAEALACPGCGGRMRLLAAIQDPGAIGAILECLGLPARAPPLAPARRERPGPELDFEGLPTYDS